MNDSQFVIEFTKTLDVMLSIVTLKNADYGGSGQDAFANFRSVEKMGICSVEQGLLTRMMDKISRVSSLMTKDHIQVKDEKITDTLHDLANYAIILKLYLENNKA